ncbi:uncharacterized protein PGTG_21572 [Puccinia graminis f. sp. tritici CRL 75-36-700-3]|uniref:Histone deacetylase interacting domain-containing protein n=1 Tax=Puccinia graminis f. sp. tritici (strain CRL 75-36-700-3 / race SCCL) TaxID=418459 RepID=H6QS05_PUCGT|nr:uncharacterized protein PGTG_21572 [Puccinia graminis f. sp. tritici CRL 75-36-700-3]EHS63440.1 hypothetical protein PGTG_21572 [Puccinia graminis f. sp. tritici CRL 75-36-700-3]
MAASTTISQPPQGNSSTSSNPTRPVTALPLQTSANASNSTPATPNTTSTVTSSLAALSSQPQNLASSSNSTSQNKYRPLNVRDALSYLDQVKVQFQDFPGVYNKFLDIMKDFKTQMIDTPGVIDGVSSLFRGHPSLIQGFNTFLPPGYRIDVSQGEGPNQTGNSSAYSIITVTHPMGIQTQKRVPLQTGGEEIGSHVVPESAAPLPPASTSEQPTRENLNAVNSANPSNHFAPQKSLNEPPLPPVVALKPKPITLDVIANLNRNPSPVPSSNLSTDQSKPPIKPLEFNHAITYVNKIKNRYASDPKTYQTFLDILQTYQRDARPIQEVYEQVNQLFSGAPDLLTEFMQFLPDPSGNAGQLPATDSAGNLLLNSGASYIDGSHPVATTSAQNMSSTSKRNHKDTPNNFPSDSKYPMSSRAGPPIMNHEDQSYTHSQHSGKKRRHPGTGAPNNYFAPSNEHLAPGGSRTHNSLQAFGANQLGETNGEFNRAGNFNQTSPSRGVKRKHRTVNKSSDPATSGTPVSGLPPPGFAPHGSATIGEAYSAANTTNQLLDRAKRKSRSNSRNANPSDLDHKHGSAIHQGVPRQSTAKEELLFFYHLKTYFENQTTYIEFLKIINLFTQDLIDLETLVLRIEPFLINCPELFSRFKDIVGWKDDLIIGKTHGPANGHLSKKKTRHYQDQTAQPTLSEPETIPECGPSYRILPDSQLASNCSGRDALCWDVLNDKLICGAPATNEDEQIFLPRQTNAFERALYQAEDERHEYDYHIEANVRTIALLEPINLRIQQMDPETRAEYRLKPGLGGQSKSVYQRIIKKIYGKQQGQEVIQALHENPTLAVPIVLARLKQKDEEWKKALRDWNRVWREVDGKNYWKALDHQGISFKAVDKKMIGNRNLVSEIELIKREQQQKQKLLLNPSMIRFLPKHQLELQLQNVEVFYDVLKILIHFLDHVSNSTGLDDTDKDRIEAQLKLIVTSFFNIPEDEFDKHLTPLPPERKGAENDASNPTKNFDTDGNETAYSEGDTSDVAGSAQNNQGDDERPEGTVGRPSRGLSARKRGPPAKDGTSNATGNTDLRKRAMKNASSGGVICNDRASARRIESNKKSLGLRTSRAPSPTDEVAASRSDVNNRGRPSESYPGDPAGIIRTSSIRDQPYPQADDANGSSKMRSNAADPSSAVCQDANSLGEQSRSSASRATRLNEVRDTEDSNKNPRPQELRLSFFANNGYYCFFRLIHILYTRFETLKLASLNADLASQHLSPTNTDHVASRSFDHIAPSAPARRHFSSYKQMLASIENFNSGVIDQSAFEEECRTLFGIKGYLLVTVDKVCQALVKVLSNLSHHPGSKKILELFQNQKKMYDSDRVNLTDCQKLSYRRSVESLTGNGHESKVYRIEWITSSRAIRIQLIGGDEISQEDFDAMEKAWSDYIASFQDMSVDRTLGLENFKLKPPFLNRNIKLVKKSTQDKLVTTKEENDFKEGNFIAETGLAIRICMRSYKMFFHPNTTEFLMRKKKKQISNKSTTSG